MSTETTRIAELEQKVALLTEQSDAARRELEAFAYAVSHDLRAPLRSLSGFSQALIELPAGNLDPKAQHYLSRIQQAGRKMAELIDALLSLSRISRADMQMRSLDLTQLCHDAANAIAGKYPDHRLVVSIAPNMMTYGDSRLIRTAMELLFDNAWKFSTQRSDAHVEVGHDDTTYFVRDNGAGFDMAYAEKLFRPFQRLHAETQFAGIGIGLATVQRIISRHNGRTWAEAQPDQGTTIFFSIPRRSE
jgi:light-regulated signal transduction histidine kinase (bacteriophytochrome)